MEQTKSIFESVSAGDIDALEGILREDPSLANARNEEKQTPLYVAAAKGNVEAAKLLLSHGADVNGGAEGWDWRPVVHALHHFIIIRRNCAKHTHLQGPFNFLKFYVLFAS